MEPLSVYDYAAHRKALGLPGGSRNAVELALADGRIRLVAEEPVRLIDPEAADKDWTDNTDGSKQNGNGHAEADRSFSKVRTEEKELQIERRRFELERDRGRVHDVAECQAEHEAAARVVRDQLLTIATRVAAEFGRDENERLAIEARIDEEIRSALEDLSRWTAEQ